MNFVEKFYYGDFDEDPDEFRDKLINIGVLKDFNLFRLILLKVDAGGALFASKRFHSHIIYVGDFEVTQFSMNEEKEWERQTLGDSTRALREYMAKIYGEPYLKALRAELDKEKARRAKAFDRETDRIIARLTEVGKQPLDGGKGQEVAP